MALSATVFKAELSIADMDKHYYATHNLTVAQHPSENDARMMLRILAYGLYARENLGFGKGVSTDDEPDLWAKSLSDEVQLWIDLGHLDEKRLRKCCGRADEVVMLTYAGSSSEIWWKQNKSTYARFKNLTVLNISEAAVEQMSELAARTMQLQLTVQDGDYVLGNGESLVNFGIAQWQAP